MSRKPEIVSSNPFTDEELMAFADGECDDALATRIAAAVDTDPAIAARVEMFMSTKTMLAQSFPPVANADADRDLASRIRQRLAAPEQGAPSGNVVQFKPKAKPSFSNAALAMAASLPLALGLAGGYQWGSIGKGPDGGELASYLNLPTDLQTALGKTPTGASVKLAGADATLIATFKGEKGQVCREFELALQAASTTVILACRSTTGWQPVFMAAKGGSADQFVPVGGIEAIETYLTTSGLGEAVSAEEEKALLGLP